MPSRNTAGRSTEGGSAAEESADPAAARQPGEGRETVNSVRPPGPGPGPLGEVQVEPGRPQHVLADLLVLVGAAAGDPEAAHDLPVPLERVPALGGDDRVLAHPADLGEEHRVGVP